MINLSDYFFYRFCKFYSSSGNKKSVISYASALVSAVQGFSILALISLLSLFLKFQLPGKMFALILGMIFLGLNWYRYEKSIEFEVFSERWKNEDKMIRIRNGYLIVSYTVFVVLFPMIIGYLRHNLGVIE